MTSDSVTLFSDRPGFSSPWREALDRHGFDVRLHGSEAVGRISVKDLPCVFDASTPAFDDDELLTVVGYTRAAGGFPIVHTEDAIEDVVEEICWGQVVRNEEDVERVAAAIARRIDRQRGRRFEFVTVAPNSGDVLAILGDGHSALAKRPLSDVDDGSDIVAIELSDDAGSVTLELDSGVRVQLQAASFAPSDKGAVDIPISGARLGQRLRQLRLEAGLTQAELAKRTGIHRPNIARVEAGRHTPSLETLARLASAIGVPTTRVLSEG